MRIALHQRLILLKTKYMSKPSSNPSRKKPFRFLVHKPVFYPALIIIILSVILVVIFNEQAQSSFENAQNIVSQKAGSVYTIAVYIFIIFCLYVALDRKSTRLNSCHVKISYA